MLEFGAPGWLWSLLLVPLIWIFANQSRAIEPARARTFATLSRACIIVCLILALAGLRWSKPVSETAVLIVVDNSASVQADGLSQATAFVKEAYEKNPGRKIAVAQLFPSAEIRVPFGAAPLENLELESITMDRTALATGIDWSGLATYPAAPTRVVLLTDGLVSDATASLMALERSQKRGTPVDIVQLQPGRAEELELGDIPIPSTMEPGRPFDLPLTVRSTVEQDVEIKIYQNDVLVRQSSGRAASGESKITIPSLVPEPGNGMWQVEVTGNADTLTENNALMRFSSASGSTRVLFIDPSPASLGPAVRAAERAGIETESRRPADFPNSLDDLTGFDVVVLSNTPASALGDLKQRLLAEWVRTAGGGLLVTGGPEAYSAGGYFGTPLADLLPVSTDYVDQAALSVSALLVSLDRSGSMSAPVAGTTKMALANAGAIRAMELLDRTDFFGLNAVDTEVQMILPLAAVPDRVAATALIQSITSGGGGIYVFTALTAAYRELSPAKATMKHLILFSDAADAEEKSAPAGSGVIASALDLAAAMLSARISVSVVALGSESDPDTEFLRALAARGGGRFYLTSDATTLPQIFAEETLRATQNSLIEQPFRPVLAGSDAMLDGVDWDAAPELAGYNAVQPRPTISPVLLTESGAPLLASWRVGLGRVTAFTSDINGRWSGNWSAWPGYAQWMVQCLRSLVLPSSPGGIVVTTRIRDNELVVNIAATNQDGTYRTGLVPTVTSSDGRSPARSSNAHPVASGSYESTFDLTGSDSGLISVSIDDTVLTTAWSRPPTNEPWVLRDTTAFLKDAVQRSGGLMNPSPEEITRPTGRSVQSSVSLVPWLISLAILLWPLDIWIRRRSWS